MMSTTPSCSASRPIGKWTRAAFWWSLDLQQGHVTEAATRERQSCPPHLLQHAVWAGPLPVQLVDERDARHAVAVHLPVHSERLALHSAYCTQHEHSSVQHAQSPLHLDGEVHMACREQGAAGEDWRRLAVTSASTWSVDDVDVGVLPGRVGGCRLGSKGRGVVRKVAPPTHRAHLYSDPPLPLQLHGVHRGSNIVLPTNLHTTGQHH